MKLFTIGYEGLTEARFFELLQQHGIEALLDVRELPVSRKRGFSKSSLALAATQRGLSYLHLGALGCPREIRYQYREDGDWNCYSRRFLDYLDTQTQALDELAALAGQRTCCLLCFEADVNFCHRFYLAQRVEERGGLEVTHITARLTAPMAALA